MLLLFRQVLRAHAEPRGHGHRPAHGALPPLLLGGVCVLAHARCHPHVRTPSPSCARPRPRALPRVQYKRHPSTDLAMGFANVRAGTRNHPPSRSAPQGPHQQPRLYRLGTTVLLGEPGAPPAADHVLYAVDGAGAGASTRITAGWDRCPAAWDASLSTLAEQPLVIF